MIPLNFQRKRFTFDVRKFMFVLFCVALFCYVRPFPFNILALYCSMRCASWPRYVWLLTLLPFDIKWPLLFGPLLLLMLLLLNWSFIELVLFITIFVCFSLDFFFCISFNSRNVAAYYSLKCLNTLVTFFPSLELSVLWMVWNEFSFSRWNHGVHFILFSIYISTLRWVVTIWISVNFVNFFFPFLCYANESTKWFQQTILLTELGSA